MEQYGFLYRENPLFKGIEEPQLVALLQCLQAQKHTYAKGETLFREDDASQTLGIVLAGRVNTVYEDMAGGYSIIDTRQQGQLFCEAFCCSTAQRMPVSVVAQTESTVLLIQITRILHTCANSCQRHLQLSENLIRILADKYVALNEKMIHLSGRTTRRKLLSYLAEQMRLAGGNPFPIPFNRQQLANYLFVDRTGLSAEWSGLKKEGILREAGENYFLDLTRVSKE